MVAGYRVSRDADPRVGHLRRVGLRLCDFLREQLLVDGAVVHDERFPRGDFDLRELRFTDLAAQRGRPTW